MRLEVEIEVLVTATATGATASQFHSGRFGKSFGVAVVTWVALPSVLGFGFVFWVLGVCSSLHKFRGRSHLQSP